MQTYASDLFSLDTPAAHFMEGWVGPADEYALFLLDQDGVILRREIGSSRETIERAMQLTKSGVTRVDEYGWNSLCERARKRKRRPPSEGESAASTSTLPA